MPRSRFPWPLGNAGPSTARRIARLDASSFDEMAATRRLVELSHGVDAHLTLRLLNVEECHQPPVCDHSSNGANVA